MLKKHQAFTIVELLIVIVVIGVLSSVALVSYIGVTQKANVVSIKSDLISAKNQINLYQVDYGSYPTSLDLNDCPSAPAVDLKYCIKPSSGNSIDDYESDGNDFSIIISNNNVSYEVTKDLPPQYVEPLNPAEWITIGTQIWAKSNLNVGTMVTGATTQTNNAVIEKYCRSNLESNCLTYGALYQWNEAMQYSTVPGSQGICPVGSHIPTDNDIKILEMFLGMSQAQADATSYRGTNQGSQIRTGGSSGLNIPAAGYRMTDGGFMGQSYDIYFWSSTEVTGTTVRYRRVDSGDGQIFRGSSGKNVGYSVRCVRD